MASVSLSVTHGQDLMPDSITVGTDAPGTGDLEVSLDLTKGFNKGQVVLALTRIIELIEDQRFTSYNTI